MTTQDAFSGLNWCVMRYIVPTGKHMEGYQLRYQLIIKLFTNTLIYNSYIYIYGTALRSRSNWQCHNSSSTVPQKLFEWIVNYLMISHGSRSSTQLSTSHNALQCYTVGESLTCRCRLSASATTSSATTTIVLDSSTSPFGVCWSFYSCSSSYSLTACAWWCPWRLATEPTIPKERRSRLSHLNKNSNPE